MGGQSQTPEIPPDYKLTPVEQAASSRLCYAISRQGSLGGFLERIEDVKDLVGTIKVRDPTLWLLNADVTIDAVHGLGLKIMADIKSHDLEDDVQEDTQTLTQLGADYITVHASGGLEMMQAARSGVDSVAERRAAVLAVTVLTNKEQEQFETEMRIVGGLQNQVLHLGRLALRAGLDGLVCAATDLEYVRNHFPKDFMIATPGIRMPGKSSHNQKRVESPADAIRFGSDMLIVGRPISDELTSQARRQAAYEILRSMAVQLEHQQAV